MGKGAPTGPRGGTHQNCGSNILTPRYHWCCITHAGSCLHTCVRFLCQLYSRQLRVSSIRMYSILPGPYCYGWYLQFILGNLPAAIFKHPKALSLQGMKFCSLGNFGQNQFNHWDIFRDFDTSSGVARFKHFFQFENAGVTSLKLRLKTLIIAITELWDVQRQFPSDLCFFVYQYFIWVVMQGDTVHN